VVSVTDPSGRILGFLDRSRYFSIKYFSSNQDPEVAAETETLLLFFRGSSLTRAARLMTR
jgi:hypothetical protein